MNKKTGKAFLIYTAAVTLIAAAVRFFQYVSIMDYETGFFAGGTEAMGMLVYIIFAVGRVGSRFFSDWCRQNEVPLFNNQIDLGVRVELPALVWQDFQAC